MSLLPTEPKVHHVGIVQPDMQSAENFMELFNHEEDYRGFVEAFSCWCIFLKAPANQTAIELVVPVGGPLAKFNKGTGGLHHYALQTDDIVGLQAELAGKDIRMLEDEPVKGAGNFLCNFVHPISTRGIIVEYVQVF
ncbi:VOC family protein [Roseibium album]|uniref:VOC family protein n=1 Tax=Roseibium album TaxID=311410 RepID=UPI002490634F|nr:VOC family protein [Roseibium album]